MNRRRYTQTLTYWAPAASNSYGEESFSAPSVIEGRWENRQDKVITTTGEEILAKVLAYVEASVAIGGYLALGSYAAQSNPLAVGGAHQIQGITELSSLRTNTVVRAAVL